MIYSLDIKVPNHTPVKWLGDVPTLKEPKAFTFTPGLNILWGRNGSGKSTLLKLMSMLLQCDQGGVPLVSETSISELCERMAFGGKLTKAQLLKSVKLVHDGQGVRLFDPSKVRGLIPGGAAFDDDFFGAGVNNMMFKGSAGQTTMFRFAEVLEQCRYGVPAPEVNTKVRRQYINSTWQEWYDIAMEFLKGTAKKGPATILLDEPERSFDLPLQAQCWRFIRAAARSHQIIVASHSVFALNIPEASYVEMEAGYLEASKKSVGLLPTWADEKPEMPPPRKKEVPAETAKTKPGKRTPLMKR